MSTEEMPAVKPVCRFLVPPVIGERKNAAETGILMELQLENKYLNDSYNFSIWTESCGTK